MSQEKPVSFHVVEDFDILIGKDRLVKIPRLKLKNATKVLNIISSSLAEDTNMTFKIISDARKADILLNKDALDSYAESLRKFIPEMIERKNYGIIISLLKEISEGIITDEILNETQFEESVKIAQYLIEQNFGSLKNLFASLQAISTSVKTGN